MADFQQRESFARDSASHFEQAVSRYLFSLGQLHATTDDSDEMSDHLTDALVQAEDAVMREPAETLDQLRIKADILWSDVDSLPPDRHILAFFADLIRLTGNAPSRVFDPARWLARFERNGGGWVVQDDRVWLMWPDLERVEGLTQELEMRGGKVAVLDLIRARHEKKAA